MNFFKNLFSKTYTTELIVTSSSGFHLRPVAQFVAKAKTFHCDIQASVNGKSVSAKAVNTLLSLNLDKQDTFTLTAKGNVGQTALESLEALFNTLMQNDEEIVTIEKQTHSYEGKVNSGEIICEGIAIAPLHLHQISENYIPTNKKFDEAVSLSLEELNILYETHKLQNDASIFLAQKELLLALTSTEHTLDSFEEAITKESHALKGGKLEAKITDYQDLLRRVKGHLGYSYEVSFPQTSFILLADDLLPSDIHKLEKSEAVGVVLKKTSPTSHTAILLRASGLPSLILDDSNIIKDVPEIILDTSAGVVVISPTPKDLKSAKESLLIQNAQQKRVYAKRHHQALTKAEKHIPVFANVSDISSAHLAKEEGAEGVGLLRTEFLFDTLKPTLQKQQEAYEEIFSLFRDITVRTLDVGGDKALPYVTLPEEKNPFLGLRGVRLLQTHPELISEQLLAIFLAAKQKPIKIMFPMIATVEEFTQAKHFAQALAKKAEHDISNIHFGIMIEVPSVLFDLESFNKVVDFYSIGTNDLSQYLFATERTHPTLKIDPLSPVMFSALETIVKKSTKPVSICGELASNKDAIAQLLNLGLERLSVTPKSIAQTKETIRHV